MPDARPCASGNVGELLLVGTTGSWGGRSWDTGGARAVQRARPTPRQPEEAAGAPRGGTSRARRATLCKWKYWRLAAAARRDYGQLGRAVLGHCRCRACTEGTTHAPATVKTFPRLRVSPLGPPEIHEDFHRLVESAIRSEEQKNIRIGQHGVVRGGSFWEAWGNATQVACFRASLA